MSSKEDHLQRTVNNLRKSQVISMTVSKIYDASPTVKYLVLNTPERPVPISFKAGQWVDMIIPEVETVGGFSICSSPIHLSRTGEFLLSIKKSDHPPSEWVHTKCKEGSEVSIRIGGDFFLDTNDPELAGKTILLVAGGVGINPLAAIVAQLQEYQKNMGIYSSKAILMFSTKSKAELLFSVHEVITQELVRWRFSMGAFLGADASSNGNSMCVTVANTNFCFHELFNTTALEDPSFSVQYFVTGEERDVEANTDLQQLDSTIKFGRITKGDVARSLSSYLDLYVGVEDINKNILVYICGPPPMIQHIEVILKSLGITNILYEKWW